jgi:AcrR family transcriptional regulator
MKNKEIQEQRIKGYFLQATKDLLKSEGLQSVNVRNIADRAGYSYATLYNYFKDINDLVFLCVHDFYEECAQHVREHVKKQERGIKRLRASIRAYVDFFVQYPGIFALFFMENLGNFKDKGRATEIVSFSLDKVCEEEWNYCVSKGLLQVEQVELFKSQIRHGTLGLLMLYINQRVSFPYTELINRLNLQTNAILEPCGPDGGGHSGGVSVHNSLISIKVK